MIYCIFVKKEKKQRGPSPIATILNLFFSRFCNDETILCLPGYMSYTQKSIDNFFNSLKFPKNSHVQFFVGMNGNRVLTTGLTVLDEYNRKGKSRNYFESQEKDHSKMMFILDSNKFNTLDSNGFLLCKEICGNELISIKAILIGSSNQSESTYFAKTAPYGEADILLIDSTKFKNVNDDSLNEFYKSLNENNHVVISKDIIHNSFDNNYCEKLFNSIFDSVAKFKPSCEESSNK